MAKEIRVADLRSNFSIDEQILDEPIQFAIDEALAYAKLQLVDRWNDDGEPDIDPTLWDTTVWDDIFSDTPVAEDRSKAIIRAIQKLAYGELLSTKGFHLTVDGILKRQIDVNSQFTDTITQEYITPRELQQLADRQRAEAKRVIAEYAVNRNPNRFRVQKLERA